MRCYIVLRRRIILSLLLSTGCSAHWTQYASELLWYPANCLSRFPCPRRIPTPSLPDALKATSASSTARHDRLLRSITQCPAHHQPTKPTICIIPYPSTWTARIIPLTRRPSHAFATAIGMLRQFYLRLCALQSPLYDTSVLVSHKSIISDTFSYYCTGPV